MTHGVLLKQLCFVLVSELQWGPEKTVLGSSPFSGSKSLRLLARPFSSSFPACPFPCVRGSSFTMLIKTVQVKVGVVKKEENCVFAAPKKQRALEKEEML